MELSVSVVIFRPNIELLHEVVTHLDAAAAALKSVRPCLIHLDIINNNPGDGVFAEFRPLLPVAGEGAGLGDVCLLDSPGNIGYGAANNLSINSRQNSDYHLVLNPDALLAADALVQAVEFMEAHPRTGLLVPKVVGFDGEIQHLCKRNSSLFDMYLRGFAPGFVQAWFAERMRRFVMLDLDYEQVISPVYYPSGCFMFFRAGLLRQIQGFDERFFMYLEDADIGRRMLRLADVAYVPTVKIRHKWARGTHNNWRLRWATVVSALRYWWKWGGVFRGTL